MKANKLTNSIYSILNEDKFAKYTIQQIYDELGKEDFVDYIDSIVRKVIKNIKGLDGAKLIVDGDVELTYFPRNRITKVLRIAVFGFKTNIEVASGKRVKGILRFASNAVYSKPNQTNISEFLKSAIITCYKTEESK